MLKTTIIIFIALLIVCTIYIWVGWFTPLPPGTNSFEAVGALFSGLAFAGVIIAVYLQSKELILQREELVLTREELRGQKEQLDKQNATFLKDNFEVTFYQLLKTQSDIVDSMQLGSVSDRRSSRECFTYFFNMFVASYNWHKTKQPGQSEHHFARQGFFDEFNIHKYTFDRYFNHLLLLIRYVDQSNVLDKDFYIQILIANLSSHELSILFYYSLFTPDPNLKELIERYRFLRTLENEVLLQLGHRQFYNLSAF